MYVSHVQYYKILFLFTEALQFYFSMVLSLVINNASIKKYWGFRILDYHNYLYVICTHEILKKKILMIQTNFLDFIAVNLNLAFVQLFISLY